MWPNERCLVSKLVGADRNYHHHFFRALKFQHKRITPAFLQRHLQPAKNDVRPAFGKGASLASSESDVGYARRHKPVVRSKFHPVGNR